MLLGGGLFGAELVGSAGISGTYVLVEHVKDVEAATRIEFHPNGSCLMSIDGEAVVPGTYSTDAGGDMIIKQGDGKLTLSYRCRQNEL